MVKLTDEQIAAVMQNPEGVCCEDSTTHRVYFLVEEQLHRQAMQALRQQQDIEAVRQGFAQMETSAGTPVEDVRDQLAREMGFHSGSQVDRFTFPNAI